MEKRKVSTFLANEEKKRLLKSGKDNTRFIAQRNITAFFKNIEAFETKRRRVLKKRRDASLFYIIDTRNEST